MLQVRVPVLSEKMYSICPNSSTSDDVRQNRGSVGIRIVHVEVATDQESLEVLDDINGDKQGERNQIGVENPVRAEI